MQPLPNAETGLKLLGSQAESVCVADVAQR